MKLSAELFGVFTLKLIEAPPRGARVCCVYSGRVWVFDDPLMQECGWVGLPNTPPLIDLLLSPCNPSWPNNPNTSTPYPKLTATHKLSDCLAFPDVRAGGVPAPQIRESTQPKHATRSHTSFTCWDHQIYKHKTSSHVTLLMMAVCHMSGKLKEQTNFSTIGKTFFFTYLY